MQVPLKYLPSLDPQLAAFIDALPKAELHLHLDGALPWEKIREENPQLPERPPFWAPHFRYAHFDAFLQAVAHFSSFWLTTPERYAEAANIMLAECAAQNVRYVETSIHLVAAVLAGPPSEILAAMRNAADRFPQMEVRLFLGICRDNYQLYDSVIEETLHSPYLDGIDLHGVETLPLEAWTDDLWRRARDLGKFTKAHAGEFGPAFSVREVVERLGVTRVEHGVRAAEDPDVVRLLKDRGVTLDVCPLSNLKLQVTPSLRAHSLAALHRAGVACTVNTDDPFFFGSTLREEYAVLALEAGLSRADLAQLAANGFKTALLPPAVRDQHLAEISRCLA